MGMKHPLPHLGLILPPLLRLLEMGPTAHAIFALVLPCVHRLLHDIVVEERRRIGLDALFREVLLPRWMAFAQSRYLVGTNGSSCTSAAIDKASLDELHAFLKCLHILVFEIPPQHSQIDDKDVEAVFITYVDAIGALSVDVQRKRDDVNQGAKTGNALDMYLDALLQVIERAPDSGPDEITMRSIPMSAVLLARHMKVLIMSMVFYSPRMCSQA